MCAVEDRDTGASVIVKKIVAVSSVMLIDWVFDQKLGEYTPNTVYIFLG